MEGKNLTENLTQYRRDAELFYRVGLRHAGRNMLDSALSYVSKAVEAQPYNADFRFGLACILAEKKDTGSSNRELLKIIREIDPTLAECYFGAGCNYFDMGNLKKAREYFEKYIYFDYDGYFCEEAQDILFYLRMHGEKPEDEFDADDRKKRAVARLAAKAERLLREGEYRKACLSLQKAVEMDPEAVSVRNTYAFACFLSGEVDRAESISRSVLKLQSGNLFAHCSLALFYGSTGRTELFDEQIRRISEFDMLRGKNCLPDIGRFFRAAAYDGNTDRQLKQRIFEILELKRAGFKRKKSGKPRRDVLVKFRKA